MAKLPASNGYDPEIVERVMREAERFKEEIASKKGEYMQFARSRREKIEDLLDRAKDEHGLPKKVMKQKLKQREYLARAEKCRSDLEAEDQDEFDQISVALGELAGTPLGDAALAKANEEARKRAREAHSAVSQGDPDAQKKKRKAPARGKAAKGGSAAGTEASASPPPKSASEEMLDNVVPLGKA